MFHTLVMMVLLVTDKVALVLALTKSNAHLALNPGFVSVGVPH